VRHFIARRLRFMQAARATDSGAHGGNYTQGSPYGNDWRRPFPRQFPANRKPARFSCPEGVVNTADAIDD